MIYLKNTTDNQIFYIMHKSSKGSGVWDLTSLDVEYTENGEYSITPPSGYDGLSRVNVTVDVPTGDYQEGYEDGIEYQKSRVQPLNVTQNHITYVNENGHSPIYVDIDISEDLELAYQDGVSDGIDQQKEKLTSATFTENGTYQREDGWNEVTVDVSGGGSCNPELNKSVEINNAASTTIYPTEGYDCMSQVDLEVSPDSLGTLGNPYSSSQEVTDMMDDNIWPVMGSYAEFEVTSNDTITYNPNEDTWYIVKPASDPNWPNITFDLEPWGEYPSWPTGFSIKEGDVIIIQTDDVGGQVTSGQVISYNGVTDRDKWTNTATCPECVVDFCYLDWSVTDLQSVQKHIDDTVTDGTDLNLHFERQLFPPSYRLQAAVDTFDGSGGVNLAVSPTTRWAFIPYVDTSNVTNMNYMFFGMINLETIPLLDTSNATSMAHMFDMTNPISGSPYMTIGQLDAQPALKYVPSIDTSNVTTTASMFKGCINLGNYSGNPVRRMSFDLSSCTNASEMFSECWYMIVIPTLLNTGNVTNWYRTFYKCGYFSQTRQESMTLDTSSAVNMTEMFYGCEQLHNLSELNCSNVTNVTRMFDGVYHLEDFGGCKYLGNAFTGTNSAAHTLDLSSAFTYYTEYPTTTLEASIHNVLSKLGNTSVSDAVVKLSTACYNMADPADIASANAKGWSVVSA